MAYSPPDGNLAHLALRNPYSPPDGNVAHLVLGVVDADAQNVAATGLAAGAFGSAVVANRAQGITAAGTAAGSFGAAVVYNYRTYASPGSIPAGSVGAHLVAFRNRYLTLSGFDASAFGTAFVDLSVRTAEVPSIVAGSFGTPTAWFRVREVQPSPAFFTPPWSQFGASTVWDGEREIYPGGIAAGGFGQATAMRNERFVSPAGIVGEVGAPDVQLGTRVVVARDHPPLTEWGSTIVFNSRQYVVQLNDEPFNLLDHAVGEPDMVENRNRVVGTFGQASSRFSNGAEVLNNARVVAPVGLDATLWGDAFTAFRIRAVAPEGVDTSYFVRWHAVHNRSSIVAPSGIARLHPGIPRVWDNTQHVDPVGGNDLTQFGLAFAAYRIRTVDVALRGVDHGFFPADIYVGLLRRYVAPEGFTDNPGTPDVAAHRNVVALHGRDWAAFGEPGVRNVTPEVRVGSAENFVSGRHYVGLRTRYVGAESFAENVVSRPYVGPRTRAVAPSGLLALRVPVHTVAFDAPQLPAQQTVLVPPWEGPSGDDLDPAAYGSPTVRPNSIYVQGWVGTQFGSPTVRSSGVFPQSIYNYDEESMFGIPTLRPTQFVLPLWANNLIPAIPEPTISPTTIWISEPPPPLSRKLNSIVDEVYSSTYPSWGVPDVSHYTRSAQQFHDEDSTAVGERFGSPEATLRVRRVYLAGIAPRRAGNPNVRNGGEVRPYWGRATEEWVEGQDYDTALYGEATVQHVVVVDPTVRPAGFAAGQFGDAAADLFNRSISVPGWYSTRFTGDNWVHPPIVVYPQGTDTTLFGAQRTSHRIQRVAPAGYYPYVWESIGFGSRLAVRHRYAPNVIGIPPGGVPTPVVTLPNLGAVVTLGDTLAMGRPRVGDCPTC